MITTILGGVLVFVLGQIALKLVVEPVHALKRSFSDVSSALLVNAPFTYNASALTEDQKRLVRERLLALSGTLHAAVMLVPCYGVWGCVFFLPSKATVYEAAQDLVAVGNWVQSTNPDPLPHIIKHLQSAADKLGIYISPNSRIDDALLNLMIQNSLGRGTVAQPTVQADESASGGSMR